MKYSNLIFPEMTLENSCNACVLSERMNVEAESWHVKMREYKGDTGTQGNIVNAA